VAPAEKHLVHGADGSITFSPERQKLHDQIVNDTLAGHERSDNPTYTVLGGGPASGKSTMVKAGAVEGIDKSVTIDPDQMKARLPEYQEGVKNGDVGAASYVHEESSYLAYRVQQAAFERGVNVTLDGCGDSSPAKMLGKVNAAKAAGYRVHAAYATVPTDVAIERATARAQKTGRWISPTVISQTHSSVSDVFPDIMNHFDDVKLFNTEGSPKLILSGGSGHTTIHDQGEWERFMGKRSSTGIGG
jgi:predicted ABC-type ATPase